MAVSWYLVAEKKSEHSCNQEDFLSALEVWLHRPQVVNKRLLAAVVHEDPREWSPRERQLSEEYCSTVSVNSSSSRRVFVRELLPKSTRVSRGRELVVIDDEQQVTFLPTSAPGDCEKHSYRVIFTPAMLSSTSCSLGLFVQHTPSEGMWSDHAFLGTTHPTLEWLTSVLLPKLVKWMCDSRGSSEAAGRRPSHVDISRYCQLYRELKLKYGPPLVENWPEATDPYKFVYEDIAIATYLLVLWEKEREREGLDVRQSFVDLGCGNGLLVYILTCEGHPGRGIDLRPRKIWRLLQPRATLEVCALTPSDVTRFPGCDWLIGNHSDELTPWIPVMAARSSYRTRYFVLPCCSHDFDKKFCRRSSDRSQYRCYLDYVRLIGEEMGFIVGEESLRIPSSKRVCQIGMQRSYAEQDEASAELRRQAFLHSRITGKSAELDSLSSVERTDTAPLASAASPCTVAVPSPSPWSGHFQPRPATELTRNCTRVDHCVKDHVVHTVATALLSREPHQDDNGWNRGGQLALGELPAMLDSLTLSQLRNEFGGLQTLLRNHSQVFQVSGGTVQLRDWSLHASKPARAPRNKLKQRDAALLAKTKLCWFHQNHPQGCPLSASQCSYAHHTSELRTRPDFQTITPFVWSDA